jgi:hypothetical protein
LRGRPSAADDYQRLLRLSQQVREGGRDLRNLEIFVACRE